MFLSDAELRQLTGRARPRAQIAWLREHRVRHYVNAADRPVVARAWLGAGNDPAPSLMIPDFAAIKSEA